MAYEVMIDNFEVNEWRRRAAVFADYSIYQTWAYQRIRIESDRQKIRRVIVKDDKDKPVLMEQVRIKKLPVGPSVGYVQFGPLVRNKQDGLSCTAEALAEFRQACVGPIVSILRLVPNIRKGQLGDQLEAMLESVGFNRVESIPPYHTMLVSLIESEDEIFSRIYKEGRRLIRRADEKGIEITDDTSDESFEILETMYHRAMRRKGFTGIDSNQFRRTQLDLADDEKMRILIARIDGEPVSAQAISHFGDTAIPVVFANNSQGLKSGAAYLLWWRSYQTSKKLGMKYYDLGGIDKEKNPKGYQYKKRMGGEEAYNIGVFDCCSNTAAKAMMAMSHIFQGFRKK